MREKIGRNHMPLSEELLKVIPAGEENALTGKLLWKQVGMWSLKGIKHRLNEMAAQGLIERKRVIRNTLQTNLYFRPSSAHLLELGLRADDK
jgi:hypothetical protein